MDLQRSEIWLIACNACEGVFWWWNGYTFPDLTEREREVLTLIAQGYPNSEIAGRLGVSSKTIRNHVSNIFNKLQVADRAQAISRARDAGLK